jgi:hypothetical protein
MQLIILKDMQNPGEDWIPMKWMGTEFVKTAHLCPYQVTAILKNGGTSLVQFMEPNKVY